MTSPTSANRSYALRLALSLWLILVVHFNPDGAAAARFVYLVRAIVEQHTFALDAWATTSYGNLLPADIFALRGHVWTDTNPGLALLATPVWAIVVLFAKILPHGARLLVDPVAYLLAHFVTTITTVMVAAVATAMLLYRWVLARTGSVRRATLAAVLYTLGTNAFFLSGLLLQNVPIACLTLVLFLGATNPDFLLPRATDTMRALVLGFTAGLAIMIDLSIAPALLVLAWPLITVPSSASPSESTNLQRALKRAPLMVLGGLPPLLTLFAYQWYCFGNALHPAQQYYLQNGITGSGFATFPDPRVLLGALFSPGAGLFVFMPVMIPAVWKLLRGAPSEHGLARRERSTIIAMLAVYLLYISSFPTSVMYGYFGPRYLAPIIPLLVGAFVLQTRSFSTRWIRAALIASFAINIMGAQNGLYVAGFPGVLRTIALWMLRGPWLPAVDQVRGDFGIMSATPYGLLLMLAVALALIWLPWLRRSTRA